MTFVDWIPSTLAVWAQLLPTVAVARTWNRAPEARRWIAYWCLFFFVSDIAQLAISRASGNNLWYFTYSEPLEDAILLWAFSHWQVKPLARIAKFFPVPEAGLLASARTPLKPLDLVPCGLRTSLGHSTEEPEQVSGASHSPSASRHTVPAALN